MIKIKSLFERDYDGSRKVFNKVVPGCEWVINGEGIPTRKFDGTACMVKNCEIYRRYDAKVGRKIPYGFIASQEKDEITGHWPGWVKCDRNNSNDKYFFEAFHKLLAFKFDFYPLSCLDGTYELIGPKVNGNHENVANHELIPHGAELLPDGPRTFDAIKTFLAGMNIEGIVWHHPDGRMVKIKKKDFDYNEK